MAAAEKFKAPEPSSAGGDMPNIVTEPTIQEESDEEEVCCLQVVLRRFCVYKV